MRYQIYEAKSVKYDAQQRVGMIVTNPQSIVSQWIGDFFFCFDTVVVVMVKIFIDLAAKLCKGYLNDTMWYFPQQTRMMKLPGKIISTQAVNGRAPFIPSDSPPFPDYT